MADRIEAWDLFLKIAEFGSFSEAARRSGTSAGQVSKTISALEDEINVRLFERTTRAVRLTPEGEARIEAAQALIETADRLRVGDGDGSGAVGTIRISAPIIYGSRILAPLINAFLREHPGLSVRLTLTDRRVDLVNDGLDLALRIGAIPDTSLMGRKLAEVTLRLLAAPTLLDAQPPITHPSDLAGRTCIIDLNMAEPRRWEFAKDGETHAVKVDGRLETDSADVTLRAVEDGLGIGLIPDFCLPDPARHGLVTLLPDWQSPLRDVWLLWPSARHLAPRTRHLVDYLARTLPAMNPVNSRD